MPAMQTEPGTASLSAIAISWLAASAAIPLALVTAVVGQGLGALVGGCHWIGISLPVGRQVWALVNQPVLNFSSLPSAGGYWLGSTALPLVLAVTLIGFLPRARSFAVELAVVQVAWSMAAVAVAWTPLLDSQDGHVVRFLTLHGWPAQTVWLMPLLAAAAGMLPTLRLLELTRRQRPVVPRALRLTVIVIHLCVPIMVWLVVAMVVQGSMLWPATLAAAVPMVAALAFAWLRYPTPYVHRLEAPRAFELTALAIGAVILVLIVWFAGRPIGHGRSAGLLWGSAHSFNNIRTWIDPFSLTGDELRAPTDDELE
jgi:hypothetical protein